MVTCLLDVTLLLLVNLVCVCCKHSSNVSEQLVEKEEKLVNLIAYNETLQSEDIYSEDEDMYVNASSYYFPETAEETFNGSRHRNASTTVGKSSDNDRKKDNETVPANNSSINCSTCAIREGDRNFRLRVIKHQIRQSLHLKSLPNMTGRTIPKMPRLTRLLQRSQVQSDSPEYSGHRGYGGHSGRSGYNEYYDDYQYEKSQSRHTEWMFTVAKTPPPDLLVNDSYVTYFRMPEETRNSIVKKATLWFYIKPKQLQKTVVEVHIHELKPPRHVDEPCEKYSLKYWKSPPHKARDWHKLDIQNTVQRWIDKPHLNYGLQLLALDQDQNNLIVTPPTRIDEDGYEPMIELKTMKRGSRRVKRDESMYSMRCSANSTESRCCRYPLRVNFVDFGWDWVIAPRDYSANYCSGECRFSMQDENHHSYMQQQATSSGPCCTPTMLSALSMLYFDHDHNILFTNLQNMKVESCGCS